MQKLVIFLLLIIGFTQTVKAQVGSDEPQIILNDSAQISLLTNTPWDGAIYALFGHTAIRIKDPTQNIDLIFNYGVFDFRRSNFIFRFVKGETDYMVSTVRYDIYVEEYEERGVGITEQIINLTKKEKQDIFNALIINALPENKIYRYNFFYDNCSTRPRDIIEKYIDGAIRYTPTGKQQTYRGLIHECTNIQPWAQFGIDLVIGADADKEITDRQKDFLPRYLMDAYKGAIITNTEGVQRNMLSETNLISSPKPLEKDNTIEPLYAGYILLIITILLSILIYKNNLQTLGKLFDTLLFVIAGLAGCIILFLMFFSEHPCTFPNWNIVWLNPLQLIVVFLFFSKSFSKGVYFYHFINFVALLAFLLAWSLVPQQLEIAFIPFILSIAIRSLMNILKPKKSKKTTEYSLPKRR